MDTVVIRLGVGLGLQNYIGWFPPVLLGIVDVLPMLLALFLYVDKSNVFNAFNTEKVTDTFGLPNENYDFIVVGAGTAGSIVANRLSQHFSVLLLERGGQPNLLTRVPGMETSMISQPAVDYNYLTVPQNFSCLACNNRQSLWNSGFGLGGSHNLNAMVYVRGHPFDYNLWSYFSKDERWRYDNLVPFFRRSEGYCDDCDQPSEIKPSIDPKYHGFEGELPVRPPPIAPLVPEFLDALAWAGVAKQDVNSPYYRAIGDVVSYTQRFGRRVTTYNAFVEPILGKRPNLKILKYAQVTRVLFEPGTNQAIGVEYEQFGKLQLAKAGKEVILSAGAIATPKTLLLSGIGPEQDLRALNIPVVANLPVGQNLQDHVGTFVGPFLINKPISILPERDMNLEAAEQFLQNATGPFTLTFARAITLWTSSKAVQSQEANWPDIQVGMASNGVSQNMDTVISQLYNLNAEVMREFFDTVKGQDAFSLIVDYAHPRSRGNLKLQSANYQDEPLIDPRYYEDPEDMRVTIEAIQRAVDIAENAPSFKQLGARLSSVPFPPCKREIFRSANYYECLARQYSLTLHHFCGTAAMGPKESPNAVVDSELRVIGVKGLRVMDTSVMPFITTTNTMAAAMVIAERGSEFVLEQWHGKIKGKLEEDSEENNEVNLPGEERGKPEISPNSEYSNLGNSPNLQYGKILNSPNFENGEAKNSANPEYSNLRNLPYIYNGRVPDSNLNFEQGKINNGPSLNYGKILNAPAIPNLEYSNKANLPNNDYGKGLDSNLNLEQGKNNNGPNLSYGKILNAPDLPNMEYGNVGNLPTNNYGKASDLNLNSEQGNLVSSPNLNYGKLLNSPNPEYSKIPNLPNVEYGKILNSPNFDYSSLGNMPNLN